mmetsp:Transcript_95330/g.205687  ORF Transcript_95330/g.205687 Transcript_95330/m.205687 type:complete len:214 (+) Transcript_95330:478-1119(+)
MSFLEICAILSAGIPCVCMQMIQSSIVNLLLRFLSSFFSWSSPDVCSEYLFHSFSMISLKLLYSLNSPYILAKSCLCDSNISKNPSIPPIVSHQLTSPFLLLMSFSKHLLRILRILYPPPLELGKAPSVINIMALRVWSKMMYMSLMGEMFCLTVFTSMSTTLAMSAHVFSRSGHSSTSSWEESGPNFFQTSFQTSNSSLEFSWAMAPSNTSQ